ncbi:unnamed protein product [Rhizophagus irregularis]|uniref:Uncharacterized protein n=1 Tax=Rhizophagus irregularis TaxID=588596 RepID=A0A915YPN7_9GLOM|nr:unnamed protein product [Rhizophagus irregularis]
MSNNNFKDQHHLVKAISHNHAAEANRVKVIKTIQIIKRVLNTSLDLQNCRYNDLSGFWIVKILDCRDFIIDLVLVVQELLIGYLFW